MFRFTAVLALLTCTFSGAARAAEVGGKPQPPANPFFALCVSTHDPQYRTPAQQAGLLKELGYAGMAHTWLDGVPETLKAVDDAGLKLYQLYVRSSVDPRQPKYDPRLKDVLQLLKGRETIVGLLVQGGRPSDQKLDNRAVEIVREIADMAAESGLRVALYPHCNDWLERFEDAIRVAEKVDRKNLGVQLNLCHFLKSEDEKDLDRLIEAAGPGLFAVTINGAESGAKGAGWDRLLLTLDRGTFDNGKLLRTLRRMGYTGPVGLQCYGILGNVRDNMKRSMETWRKLLLQTSAGDAKAGTAQ